MLIKKNQIVRDLKNFTLNFGYQYPAALGVFQTVRVCFFFSGFLFVGVLVFWVLVLVYDLSHSTGIVDSSAFRRLHFICLEEAPIWCNFEESALIAIDRVSYVMPEYPRVRVPAKWPYLGFCLFIGSTVLFLGLTMANPVNALPILLSFFREDHGFTKEDTFRCISDAVAEVPAEEGGIKNVVVDGLSETFLKVSLKEDSGGPTYARYIVRFLTTSFTTEEGWVFKDYLVDLSVYNPRLGTFVSLIPLLIKFRHLVPALHAAYCRPLKSFEFFSSFFVFPGDAAAMAESLAKHREAGLKMNPFSMYAFIHGQGLEDFNSKPVTYLKVNAEILGNTLGNTLERLEKARSLGNYWVTMEILNFLSY